jgi:hypothetical protein
MSGNATARAKAHVVGRPVPALPGDVPERIHLAPDLVERVLDLVGDALSVDALPRAGIAPDATALDFDDQIPSSGCAMTKSASPSRGSSRGDFVSQATLA